MCGSKQKRRGRCAVLCREHLANFRAWNQKEKAKAALLREQWGKAPLPSELDFGPWAHCGHAYRPTLPHGTSLLAAGCE